MRLLSFSLLLLFPLLVFSGWTETDTIGVRDDNSKRTKGIFVSTETSYSQPYGGIPANQWVTIDLSDPQLWEAGTYPNLPPDTKSVFLSGILIISHPGGSVTCNLWANFRAPGDTLGYDSYQMQTIEATPGAGSRSTAAVWVPVVDRKFEFYWHYTPGCPSAINLSLQAYTR